MEQYPAGYQDLGKMALTLYAKQTAFRSLSRKKTYALINVSGLAVGIALVTISVQAIRAAVANPVKSLRTE